MSAASRFLGFDIGGTKCAVVLGEHVGNGLRIIAREQFATHSERGPEPILSELEQTAEELLAAQGWQAPDLAGIGISCGGPLSSTRGLILSPPNLPGWDAIPICARFHDRFAVPTQLDNDANAGALAEWRFGAGRGCDDVIFLTMGTGFGAGLILGGRLHRGADDLAGEVGHLRLAEDGPVGFGKAASVEGFCSGGGIARLAQQHVRDAWARGETVAWCSDEDVLARIDCKLVCDQAGAGDTHAQGIIAAVGQRLGQTLALLIDLLNPQCIVIGSIFTRAGELFRPHLEAVIARECLPAAAARCQIVPAQLGEQIGDYACLCVAEQTHAVNQQESGEAGEPGS